MSGPARFGYWLVLTGLQHRAQPGSWWIKGFFFQRSNDLRLTKGEREQRHTVFVDLKTWQQLLKNTEKHGLNITFKTMFLEKVPLFPASCEPKKKGGGGGNTFIYKTFEALRMDVLSVSHPLILY